MICHSTLLFCLFVCLSVRCDAMVYDHYTLCVDNYIITTTSKMKMEHPPRQPILFSTFDIVNVMVYSCDSNLPLYSEGHMPFEKAEKERRYRLTC